MELNGWWGGENLVGVGRYCNQTHCNVLVQKRKKKLANKIKNNHKTKNCIFDSVGDLLSGFSLSTVLL